MITLNVEMDPYVDQVNTQVLYTSLGLILQLLSINTGLVFFSFLIVCWRVRRQKDGQE